MYLHGTVFFINSSIPLASVLHNFRCVIEVLCLCSTSDNFTLLKCHWTESRHNCVKEMHILDHTGLLSQIIFSSLLSVKHVKVPIKHRSFLLRCVGAALILHVEQNLLVSCISCPDKASLAGAALWDSGSGCQYLVWKTSRFKA